MAEASSSDEFDDVLLEASLQYEQEQEQEQDSDDDDNIFLAASQQYEQQMAPAHDQDSDRFVFVTDNDIANAVKEAVPHKTRKQTRWCYGVWCSWRLNRIERAKSDSRIEVPPELSKMNEAELCVWMPRFLFEARRADGKEYAEQSIYNIACGLLRYLREAGKTFDFFTDSCFLPIRNALDAKMKSLRRAGGGLLKRSDVILEEEEELLWSKGLLGSHSPDTLRDTIIFMCGLYFSLRGGSELRNLKPQHITVNTSSSGETYLLYRETGSKNNPGGINNKRVNNKEVPHFKNRSNPSRDFVSLYILYRSKCPPEAEFLFLQSMKRPSGSYWYCNRVVGHNVLAGTVKRLCSLAGIIGKKTNHSLRATRLFKEGIDEQLIMSITGHRSTDGVRAYKHISSDQYKQMSAVLQRSTCTTATDSDEPISVDDKKSYSKSPPEATDTKLPSFVLTNCTDVKINFTK